ncbi:MAG: hypothetical protein EPN23_09360 [Verrucomicrobia bacterium]|nr:MAG: hypothetical protein EPN23_09360 [Verrucomicrobiota bacterium]
MNHLRHRFTLPLKTSAALAALVLLGTSGCVRVPIQKEKIETRLITVTTSSQTTLCWDSRTDLIYTVLVAERFDAAQWQPLANLTNLRGTGARMQFQVPEDPNHPRTYKLYAHP